MANCSFCPSLFLPSLPPLPPSFLSSFLPSVLPPSLPSVRPSFLPFFLPFFLSCLLCVQVADLLITVGSYYSWVTASVSIMQDMARYARYTRLPLISLFFISPLVYRIDLASPRPRPVFVAFVSPPVDIFAERYALLPQLERMCAARLMDGRVTLDFKARAKEGTSVVLSAFVNGCTLPGNLGSLDPCITEMRLSRLSLRGTTSSVCSQRNKY